jgi:hypothetical protein
MKIQSLKNKKAAIEMSISTIVVIVLAMSMLILGLVLVRTIFGGAKYNVDALNKNVEAEINKLFNEKGGRIFVYLPNNQADVTKGKSFGVAFAIKNDVQGETGASTFAYETKAASIQKGCQLTLEQADGYVVLGGSGSIQLSPGDEPKMRLIKIQPSGTAPLCEISYDLIVKKDGLPYDTSFFILKITG